MNYKRNYGIDLLRMIAMFMIVILHINYHGGMLDALIPGTTTYNVVWLGEIICYCAVNCYALISGYVGVNAKYHLQSIVKLWLRVEFYSIVITGVCMIYNPSDRTMEAGIRALLPITSMQYWYFTAYAGMFIFIPFMNKALEVLEKKQIQVALAGSLTFVCILCHLFQVDLYGVNRGYSVIWLSLLYLLGGYIRIYGNPKRYKSWIYLLLCMGIALAIWGYKTIMVSVSFDEEVILGYTAPGIVLISVFLLYYFAELRIGTVGEHVITKIAPLVFSVYLVHDHPLFRENFIQGRFAPLVSLPAPYVVMHTVGFAILLYAFCCAVDFVRQYIFVRIFSMMKGSKDNG